MADDRELKLKVKVDDQASRPLTKIGDAADDTTADFAKMNLGLKKLDDKLGDTKKTLADLRQEVARSGDLDLLKDIQKQEARLKAITRQRKSLVGDGADEATGFFAKFQGRLGPLLASAPVSPPLLAAFAAAAPGVVPIISAAVMAGVATATVGAGLKIAFQDPDVKAAGKSLSDEIGSSLQSAARPFVPAAKSAIAEVRGEFRSLQPEIREIFADGARYVPTLTRAVTGFTREVVPALRDVNREAEPLVETLGEHGPKAGRAFGDVLQGLSADAGVAAVSLDGLLTSIEFTLGGTGKLIEWANKAGPYLGAGGLLGTLASLDNKKDAIADGPEPDPDPVKKYGEAARVAAGDVETFAEALDRLAGVQIDAGRASIGMEEAIDDAAAAVKENGKTLDINTQKGRDNKEALYDIAEASRKAYNAILAQNGSQESANATMTRGKAEFIKAAIAMNMDAAAARKLANDLFRIPNVDRSVTIRTKQAQAAISAVQQSLGKIKDIHRGIYYTAHGDLKLPGGTQMKYSQGGPVHGTGPKGVDSVPALLAPGEEVLTAADVDAAGGHAAIERWRRNLRAGGVPSTAVGGMPPGATMVAPAPVVQINATGAAGLERVFLSWLVKAIVDGGGNPKVLGLGGRW